MLQPDFSDYLNSICKGIKSKSKRDDVMEELLCHLEANYERNLAVGMSEDEAKADAINKMGDGATLSYRLSAVHSYSPLKAMNSAFISLIVAYLAMNLNFVGSISEILFLIGIPVMFSPLLRMRKMNGTMEKAFHLFNISSLFYLFLYWITLGNKLPLWIIIAGNTIVFSTQGFFWFFLFKGLHDFCQPYLTEVSKKPYLMPFAVFNLLFSWLNGIMLISIEVESIEFDWFYLSVIFIFVFSHSAKQLYRVRKVLWDADGEYGILPYDGKHLKIWLGVIAACFVTVLTFNYLASTRAPVKTELIIHDAFEAEQKEADRIRQKMLDWDIDKQVVEDLPDSEILKYKDAAFVTWGADGGSVGSSTSVFGADSIVWYYWFFIPDESHECEYHVRLLCYIESHYADSVKSFYRKGFYYIPWSKGAIPLNLEDELNGSFISIVTEEKGRKYNAEPFFTHNLTDENITAWPKGFEYKEEKGQRVYFAAQMGITALEEQQILHAETVRQRWLCSFNYNSTADFAERTIEYYTLFDPFAPFVWRKHDLVTGNLDKEAVDELMSKSKEMK